MQSAANTSSLNVPSLAEQEEVCARGRRTGKEAAPQGAAPVRRRH